MHTHANTQMGKADRAAKEEERILLLHNKDKINISDIDLTYLVALAVMSNEHKREFFKCSLWVLKLHLGQ